MDSRALEENADDPKPRAGLEAQQFGLRLTGWLLVYAALLVPWGAYNLWPAGLLVGIAYTPLCLGTAAGLIRRHRFGWATPSPPSHWELLVAFLMLAIGIATGYMLIMAVAWICLGVAWLRPVRPDLPWIEWYKLPVLCLFCLPVLSDLTGSRHDWLLGTGQAALDVASGRPWTDEVGGMVLPRLGLLALAWLVRGGAFWVSLLFLPLPLLLAAPGAPSLPFGGPWILPALALALLVGVAWSWPRRSPTPSADYTPLTDELWRGSHALWIAALVTLMQQQSLVEVWRAGGRLMFDLSGTSLLLLALLILRLALPHGPVDFRSRVVLVASQLILFAAEFTDLNPLRHVALGVFLVAAISWERTWNWIIFVGASLCWSSTLPASEAVLMMAGLAQENAALLRLGAFLITLLMVVGAGSHAVNHPSPPSQAQHDWQPEQRLVFILVVLLLFFQTLSAFAPAQALAAEQSPARPPFMDSGYSVQRLHETYPSLNPASYQIRAGEKTFELRIYQLGSAPLAATSTETLLGREHWLAAGRQLVSHSHGQVATIDLRRDAQTGHAVYWFQHGRRTFVNHLRARRILWSSWNLTRRDLQFFLLLGTTPVTSEDLLAFARTQAWLLPAH